MNYKKFKVYFYAGQAKIVKGGVFQVLSSLNQEEKKPIISYSDNAYEVRHLELHPAEAVFSGIFAKIRKDDIPHIGRPGGMERDIDMRDDEGIIEKNHFLLFKKDQVLVWQANRNASSEMRFAHYLGEYVNAQVMFDPILQPEPMKRLVAGHAEMRSLKVRFARPTNPEVFKNQWNQSALSLLSESNGAEAVVEIKAEGLRRRHDKGSLVTKMKSVVRELMKSANVTEAKVVVSEDGVDHPVDLIADRIISEKTVEMMGRYPNTPRMFSALSEAMKEKTPILKEYFEGDQGALG